MTWTKLGEEFSDAARDLSDAAYRTYVDALCWSNRRQLDLLIPKRDLRRFGETDDPATAVKELVHAEWWEDRGDAWYIGLRFADWQEPSVVVTARRERSALTTRRSRLHHADDHSLCLPRNCAAARAGDGSRDTSQQTSHQRSPGTERYGAERKEAVTGTEMMLEEDGWPLTRRPGSGPPCRLCDTPVDPAVGLDVHPGCEEEFLEPGQ
ncbi:hypothetical protein [Modestobacter sp. SYSU DS0511]